MKKPDADLTERAKSLNPKTRAFMLPDLTPRSMRSTPDRPTRKRLEGKASCNRNLRPACASLPFPNCSSLYHQKDVPSLQDNKVIIVVRTPVAS
jgi:hypothetical protein